MLLTRSKIRGAYEQMLLSRQRPWVRVPSSPPIFSSRLWL